MPQIFVISAQMSHPPPPRLLPPQGRKAGKPQSRQPLSPPEHLRPGLGVPSCPAPCPSSQELPTDPPAPKNAPVPHRWRGKAVKISAAQDGGEHRAAPRAPGAPRGKGPHLEPEQLPHRDSPRGVTEPQTGRDLGILANWGILCICMSPCSGAFGAGLSPSCFLNISPAPKATEPPDPLLAGGPRARGDPKGGAEMSQPAAPPSTAAPQLRFNLQSLVPPLPPRSYLQPASGKSRRLLRKALAGTEAETSGLSAGLGGFQETPTPKQRRDPPQNCYRHPKIATDTPKLIQTPQN